MTWTTWELLAAGGVGLLLGLWVAMNKDLWIWVGKLQAWWRERRARDVARGHVERARHAWGLSDEEEVTAEIMADRWRAHRCVFCGRPGSSGPRCDAQVEWCLHHGVPTWETEELDTILAYVLLGDQQQEVER